MSAEPTWQSGDGCVQLYHGDCVEAMAALDESSVDTILCDPPYGLEFMGKAWDKLGDARNGSEGTIGHWQGSDGAKRKPGASGYAGMLRRKVPSKYEAGAAAQQWHQAWAEVALRVAKPGAMLLAFGGTRTHHRLMCGLEDAGWEIRDTIMWAYGTGFPKSHDISKAIDKAAGAEREVTPSAVMQQEGQLGNISRNRRCLVCGKPRQSKDPCRCPRVSGPATAAAQLWHGWGTALKPAWEPIVVAMKPLDGTFAHNALTHGVAGFSIDRSRVGIGEGDGGNFRTERGQHNGGNWGSQGRMPKPTISERNPQGRWPANLIHDGSEEVLAEFGKAGKTNSAYHVSKTKTNIPHMGGNGSRRRPIGVVTNYGDAGTAARFFYCAKASRAERTMNGRVENAHPTVKPLALMRYLCRLTSTPTGGTLLDPFMGSGSTIIAAFLEGRRAIGIERDEDSYRTAEARVRRAIDDEREAAPLFAGA